MKTLFIADQFADVQRDRKSRYPGGAELTDAALLEGAPFPVEVAEIQGFSPERFAEFESIIVGNLARAKPAQLRALARSGRHILFEHDYRICKTRGQESKLTFLSRHRHQKAGGCTCRNSRYFELFESAQGVIYLTELQRDYYLKNPGLPEAPSRVLGSSIMSAEFFKAVEQAKSAPPLPREGWALLASRHRAKGFREALAACKKSGRTPRLLENLKPEEVWQVFREVEGLLYLPNWREPAGRLPLEARFFGAQVECNDRVGVTQEAWWQLEEEAAWAYLKDAAPRFWRLVAELRSS